LFHLVSSLFRVIKLPHFQKRIIRMAALVYKQIRHARTVLFLLFMGIFACFPPFAHAQNADLYTIEGVEVDVVAENAVKAREKALMDAQVKAYEMLKERLLGDAAKSAPNPSADDISLLMQDFEVTNEQLSRVRYKGTFTIRFRPNALKSRMAAQGQSVDPNHKPVLVLPFYQAANRTVLWGEPNPFLKAWRSMPAAQAGLQATVVPLGDVSDVTLIDDGNVMDYDPMQVQKLAARYQADDAAIVLAAPELGTHGQRLLTISLYRHGFEGPRLVHKMTFEQARNETDDVLFVRAATRIKAILASDWKGNAPYAAPSVSPQPPSATQAHAQQQQQYAPPVGVGGNPPVAYTRQALGPATTYNTYARFASMQDWIKMKNTLERVYGVQSVVVKTIRPKEALLDVRYAGNLHQFQAALQNAGIMLRANSANGPVEIFLNAQAQQPLYQYR
jgi:hypothetical protein